MLLSFAHLRYGEQHRDNPYNDDQFYSPGKFRHALRHERMTNGHVPFCRERRYGEHSGVGRHFGEQSSELTKYLTEHVRISGEQLNRISFRESLSDGRIV